MSDSTPATTFEHSEKLSDGQSQVTSTKSHWDGKTRVTRVQDDIADIPQAENSSSDDDTDDDDNGIDKDGKAVVQENQTTIVHGEKLVADEDLLEEEDPEAEDITIVQAKIHSMSALQLGRFGKLKRLCLRQNLIPHITIAQDIAEALEDLDLYDNLISHLKGLDKAVNLRSFDLSYNKIKHIKNINHCKQMEKLYLIQNKLTRIENLDGMANLTYLELGANRIREIAGLETLVNLEELFLGQNKITEIKGLSTLKKLRVLSIQSNRIKSLQGLQVVPQIEELYMADNELINLDHLEHLPNIITLDVTRNPIPSLEGVGHLTKLQDFWASGCKFADFNELEKELRDKKDLQEVYLEFNPLQIQNRVLYRNKVKLALPQVSKIDATYIR